jgi:hypothetical protein
MELQLNGSSRRKPSLRGLVNATTWCAVEDPVRCLRGGSFNNNHRNARVAYRNRNNPDNHNDNQGFRVVVAHDTLSLPEILRVHGCVDEAPIKRAGGPCPWPRFTVT